MGRGNLPPVRNHKANLWSLGCRTMIRSVGNWRWFRIPCKVGWDLNVLHFNSKSIKYIKEDFSFKCFYGSFRFKNLNHQNFYHNKVVVSFKFPYKKNVYWSFPFNHWCSCLTELSNHIQEQNHLNSYPAIMANSWKNLFLKWIFQFLIIYYL